MSPDQPLPHPVAREPGRPLKVGVLCECSGAVRDAFLALGHDAVSCDLKPTRRPGPHIQGDCMAVDWRGFDLLVMHPDCTYLTVSGAWAFTDGPYHQRVKPGTLVGAARRAARAEAVDFVARLMALPVPRLALENPIGRLSTLYRKPDQIIHPWQFGHGEMKSTCLWLKGLPPLVPTDVVAGRDPRCWRESPGVVDGMDRKERRSNTFPGIAAAMAMQWGGDVREGRVAHVA